MYRKGDEILKLESLRIGYSSGNGGKPILPPLTAYARRGELIAVIGRNGIGKSTLLRTIAGLQPSLGGAVLLEGLRSDSLTRLQLAQKIGYISTEIVRVIHMRVYDLVALGRFPYTNWIGTIDHNDHLIIKDAISKTGLTNFEDRVVSELSDGERQRAMIARVLAQDTNLMIMDEPTAFLDISGRYEIISLMRKLTAAGRTIVFSTHDFSIAVSQADKIWLMLDTDLAEGAPEDLMLSGALANLFDKSVVGFNPEEGNFIFRYEPCGELYVEGNSALRNWTIKALERAGYKISHLQTFPYVRLIADKNEWILVTGDESQTFRSLYDLVSRLRKIT